ncbi:SDR family NAD(P)-dependent oxidoreductase [Streptomyces sp. NPDC058000]|uniref:SDR family NAD(P)-dependent oxidoreductase n=1 Tax=Streptomyces sp. NPDC058000 TaxID=3346299 RepID=UPI0036ED0B1B
MSASNARGRYQPIAIVGAACRLPGDIVDLGGLWRALEEGRDLIGEAPPERFDATRFIDTSMPRTGKSYTAAGGFLSDVASFDAEYFGITPREAAQMDPQHRLLLELAAEALDDAAIAPRELAGSDTAVYVGICDASYGALQLMRPRSANAYTMAGSSSSLAANRLSHCFDLRGPSMAIDTACSSSLVALDRACRTLWDGTSHTALAAGANVLLSPYHYVGFSQASMLSKRGRCAAFSAEADGFVRAEGGGLVVLKRLKDARADGDRVHGVILGSGSNSDGRTAGVSLPNPEAQEDLLRAIYEQSGVSPDELVYLEAHGTGTLVGDPAECRAIGRALGRRRRVGVLPIGSVKSNLGHLEPASGIAGLLKALLVLHHGTAPASLHSQPANPDIDFTGLNLAPVVNALHLPDAARPAVGVNSFGFGGSNAHVIVGAVQEVPGAAGAAEGVSNGTRPVLVSARTPQALRGAVARMAERLARADPDQFYDLAHTATMRRGAHQHRAVVIAAGPREAADRLADTFPGAGEPGEAAEEAEEAHRERGAAVGEATEHGRVAFVFSGNGSQWAGMGAGLRDGDGPFATALAVVDAALLPHLGWSVAERLGTVTEAELAATEVAQPLLFAVQLGVTAVLRECGITPSAVIGHSVGEVAAAHVAGALSLQQAARVIAERSRAQTATAGCGRMAALALPQEEAADVLVDYPELAVAAVNSDHDVTVSGPESQLLCLAADMSARGTVCTVLELDYAFHSAAMDALREPLLRSLDDVTPSTTRLPLFSTVTGGPIDGIELDADYWWRNVREPVQFGPAVEAAVDHGADVFLEIGPHPVLRPYLRRITGRKRTGTSAVVPTLQRATDGGQALRTAVEAAMAAGADIDWTSYFPRRGRVVDLPAYPWQRERHWSGSPHGWVCSSGNGQVEHPLLGERMPGPHPVWHGAVEPALVPWMADHRLAGSVVVPATAYVEMILAAGERALGTAVSVDRMDISNPLTLPWAEASSVHTQLALNPDDGVVTITSTDEDAGDPRPHVRARVRQRLGSAPGPLDLAGLRARCTRRIAAADQYKSLAERGLAYGPEFQVLTELHVGAGEVLAAYRHTDSKHRFTAHPALLDGALQAGAPLLDGLTADGDAYLPSAFNAVHVWRTPAAEGLVHVRERSGTPAEACWDITVTDEDGAVTVELTGCRLRRLANPTQAPVTRHHTVLRAAPHPDTPSESSPLPSSRLIAVACEERIAELHRSWRSLWDAEAAELCQEYFAACIAAALERLLPDPARPFTLAALTEAGMLAKRIPLLETELPVLERHGFVTRAAPDHWLLAPAERRSPDLYGTRLLDFPASVNEAALVARNGARALPLLRGECDPLETLTGEGAGHALELFFDTAPFSRFHNRIAQTLVDEVARRWPADRPLRVLEVGAGTGGLTSALLPVLPADRTSYVYTDVSAYFLPRAQQRFARYDFVRYRTFDLDGDPAEQGLAEGGFDLVVASNALHTCRDLTATLQRIAVLLASGGRLLSFESHSAEWLAPWFGTLDGFWHQHTDRELRPRSALLPRAEWPPLLQRCGFTDITHIGDEGESDLAPASVVLATAPRRSPVPPPALPTGPESAAYVIVPETPAEAPLADSVAELLAASGRHAVHRAQADEDVAGWRPDGGEPAEERHLMLILADTTPSDVGGLTERAAQRAIVLRNLAQTAGGNGRTSLWLVTRPSGALPAPERVQAPADAAAWGIARTMDNEYPDLTVRRISLDRSGTTVDDAHRLARELLAPSQENEILLTRGGRFVPRETPLPATPADAAASYTLDVHSPGLSYALAWKAAEPREPGVGEVTVAVRAAALNYRDVMSVTGLLPSELSEGTPYTAPGLEYAGIVTAVGPGVRTTTVGDRVFGLASAALASHVTTPVEGLWPLPDGMSFEAAATLPVAFSTVHYSLEHLARLRANETVLIHGGAGGVGLAVLQFARLRGAHVIATAGSETKRDLLRVLGAEHVLDSRTLDFAEDVKRLTGGLGVDVVINSLAGEAIGRSLELLRPGGRFIELGKRDIYENKPLSLAPFRNSLAFFGVDLLALMHRPDDALAVIEEVGERVRSGTYRPLPHTVFPAARVREAFELMQHSRHIGKVVVAFDPLDEPLTVGAETGRSVLDPQGTYLVTGGLSGFGAATAHWLADRGARHLALVSRRGTAAPEAPALLDALARRGIHVTAHATDCTDVASMSALLDGIDAGGRPLRGVVHCAMHLDDAPLSELSEERLAAVLAPKAGGALVLDRLTRDRRLDMFLLISSATACFGNLHQAPYVAGNLFVEALARQRRAAGLPAQAIAWGALGETGYVIRNDLTAQLSALGLEPLCLRDAFTALDDLLTRDTPVAGVGRYNWGKARALLPTLNAPRHTLLLPEYSEAVGASREEMVAALAALPPEEARAALQDAITQLLAKVTQLDPAALDPHRRMDEYGIDSLMAAELLTSMRHQFDIDIPPMELLRSNRTIDGLTTLLHLRLGLHSVQPSAAEPMTAVTGLPTQQSAPPEPPVLHAHH